MLRVAIALTCLLLLGCEPLWKAANPSRLESDVRELLKTASVVPHRLACRMVDATRNASCSLRISQAEAASVIQALALERIKTSSESPTHLAWLSAHAGPSCVAGPSASLVAFGIAGRPKALRLPNGSAFEYLLLAFDQSTGQARVQVSYSYG